MFSLGINLGVVQDVVGSAVLPASIYRPSIRDDQSAGRLWQDLLQTIPVLLDGDPTSNGVDINGVTYWVKDSLGYSTVTYQTNGIASWLQLDGFHWIIAAASSGESTNTLTAYSACQDEGSAVGGRWLGVADPGLFDYVSIQHAALIYIDPVSQTFNSASDFANLATVSGSTGGRVVRCTFDGTFNAMRSNGSDGTPAARTAPLNFSEVRVSAHGSNGGSESIGRWYGSWISLPYLSGSDDVAVTDYMNGLLP